MIHALSYVNGSSATNTRSNMVSQPVSVWPGPLMGVNTRSGQFSQTWVWLALILFAIAFGVAQAVHMPNLRRMNALMGELNAMQPAPAGPGAMAGPPPQVLELLARGKKAAIVGTFLNVMV